MPLAKYLAPALFAAHLVSPLHAQTPAPPLQSAERAFADTLMRHDRSAFAAMFTPDAECSVPVLTRGPEAITKSWILFLVDPATTMIFDSKEVTTEPSGDVGHTSGTMAIRGRTNAGVQTIDAGTYALTWQLVDGQWKISRLSGSMGATPTATTAAPTRPAPPPTANGAQGSTDAGGVGPFHFGMTRTEVSQVPDCPRYTPVAVTGGLECAPFRFEGQEMNISFLFTGDRLRRIQLWFYEGQSAADAEQAVGRVVGYLERVGGGVTVRTQPDMSVTPGGVMKMLNSAPRQQNGVAQLELVTMTGTQPQLWFSRVVQHPLGFLVLLFADARPSP